MTERNVPFEVVDLDYKQTNDLIKLLTDIRFKLLAFFPPLVTVGVGLISVKGAAELGAIQVVGVGVLGFALTLGVILYDLRNSQLYDALVHRAKVLESILGCVGSGLETAVGGPRERLVQWPARRRPKYEKRDLANPGGPHTQRPPSFLRFLLFDVNHGTALALVYAALLGAWMFPIVSGFLALFGVFAVAAPATQWTMFLGFSIPPRWPCLPLLVSLAPLVLAISATVIFFQRLRAADLPSVVTCLGYRHPERPPSTDRFLDEAEIAHRKVSLERWWRFGAAETLSQTYGLKSGRIRRRAIVRVLNRSPSGTEVRLCGGTVKVLASYEIGSCFYRSFQFAPDNPLSSDTSARTVRLARRKGRSWKIQIENPPIPNTEPKPHSEDTERSGSPDKWRLLAPAQEKQIIAGG